MIPILIDHNTNSDPIGHVDKHMMVTMEDGHALTPKAIFKIFGNVGVQYEEFSVINGVHFVRKFRIVCFSKSTYSDSQPANFSQIRDMGLRHEYLEYLKGEIKAGRISLDGDDK